VFERQGSKQYVLKRSEEKFIAQSICKTKSELKVEQAPSSVDQLSGMLWQ
jgi:hypothetical protein